MSWVAVAVAGAGVAGAAIGSKATGDAADTQAGAAREANALQKQQYDDTVARNAPFVTGGLSSFNALLDRLGLSGNTSAAGYGSLGQGAPTAEQVMAEPGYQFGLDQGMNALGRQLNARGMSYSGAQLKAANRFGNDYASQQYGNAFNRMQSANQQAYNQLSGVANMGQNSANNTGQAGANYATQAGANLQGAANAQGAAGIAQANLWGNALNQGASAYRNYQAPASTANTGSWGTTGAGSQGWGTGDAWGNQDMGQYLG